MKFIRDMTCEEKQIEIDLLRKQLGMSTYDVSVVISGIRWSRRGCSDAVVMNELLRYLRGKGGMRK